MIALRQRDPEAMAGGKERAGQEIRGRLTQALDQLAAKRAARARPATGFVSHPEPRTIGSFARGRQLIAGNFQFAGYLIEGPGQSIWDLPMPDPSFEQALHGFAWLDDLSAVGDAAGSTAVACAAQGSASRSQTSQQAVSRCGFMLLPPCGLATECLDATQ